MAKFSMEETMAIVACQQAINDWATELDLNNGVNIRDLVSEDVRYTVRGEQKKGREAVADFYAGRLAGFAGGEVPFQRHLQSNFRYSFISADEVAVTFTLVFFTTAGNPAGIEHADPAAVADVRMECTRDASGEWLISMFDSTQNFRRVLK